MKTTLLLVFCFLFGWAQAQDISGTENGSKSRISVEEKHFFATQLGFFDPWVGVYYERNISARFGLDIAGGLIGASIGAKVYFPKLSKGKGSFYTGLSEGILLSVGPKHYIPLGYTYIAESGFRLALDVGPQIYWDPKEELQFGISLKMGKQF